jgi:putative SOS response-associated peptidase YedK
MCGRYVLAAPDDLSERFQLRQLPMGIMPRWNAAPGQSLPVIVEEPGGGRVVRLMHWGLVPRWSSTGGERIAPINARVEGIADKAMFRNLITRKRCLVPANGFYEWQAAGKGGKQPFYIHQPGDAVFAFAAVWDDTFPDEATPGESTPAGSFTIVTTDANAMMAPFHHRMPVILRPEVEAGWLDARTTDAAAATALITRTPEDALEAYAVSTAVNNVRHEGPELVAPWSPPVVPQQASLF